MTKGRAAAERVTEAEFQARRFFYWGFEKDETGEIVSFPARVARVHRWINQPWGKSNDKLIDLTGATWYGQAFSVEVKQFDTRLGNGRFDYASIGSNQHQFLTRDFVHGAVPHLWLSAVVDSQDRRRENYVMFLIPWCRWLDVEATFFEVYQSGRHRLWRSINLPWLIFFFNQYMLTEFSYKENTRTERTWFTRAEVLNKRRDPRGLPIPQVWDTEEPVEPYRLALMPDDPGSTVEEAHATYK